MLATGMAIVVLPWSARNYATTGSFFLVDTNGPFNIALGAEPRARFIDKDDNWNRHWARVGGERYINVAQRDPGRAQRLALGRWVRHVSADPLGYAAGSLWEASHLFTLDDFIGRHLRNRWYGKDLPKWLTGVYAVSASLFTALLFLGGGIALVAQPASPLRNFSVLVVVHAVMLFGLTFSLSRYSVPLRPFFAVAVAWLVTHRGEVMKRLAGNRLRAIVAALVALFLLGSWSRDLPMLKDMVVDGGKNHRFTRGR